MEEKFKIIFGQDMPHCDDHCYEDKGYDRWRCINRDHVEYGECSEDWLHCKIDFTLIENPTGNNPYCEKHQSENTASTDMTSEESNET